MRQEFDTTQVFTTTGAQQALDEWVPTTTPSAHNQALDDQPPAVVSRPSRKPPARVLRGERNGPRVSRALPRNGTITVATSSQCR